MTRDTDHQGSPGVRQSRLTCIKCGYNLTGVAIGGVCPECGVAIEESMQAYARGERRSGTTLQNVSYVGPVLVTLFCCIIGGIVSVVYTAKANTAAAQGDHLVYTSLVKTRNRWMIYSIIITVLMVVLEIVASSASSW